MRVTVEKLVTDFARPPSFRRTSTLRSAGTPSQARPACGVNLNWRAPRAHLSEMIRIAGVLSVVLLASCSRSFIEDPSPVRGTCRRFERSTPPPISLLADATTPDSVVAGVVHVQGRMLSDVVVELIGETRHRDSTNARGEFRWEHVPPGRYVLMASVPWMVKRSDAIDVPVRGALRIPLLMPEEQMDGCGSFKVMRPKPWWRWW